MSLRGLVWAAMIAALLFLYWQAGAWLLG
jgi:hypothetical protein